MPESVAIEKIKVGPRFRKDLGHLESLQKSIQEIGLLQPIVVTSDHKLVAGRRRLEACRALAWKKVPVHIVNLEKVARGEHDENVFRKQFLPSERVAIRRALWPELKKAAKERQRQAGRTRGKGKQAKGSGKLPEADAGEARAQAAAALGVSPRTLDKETAVVVAAEVNPERYGDLVEKMDKTGKPDPVYKELQKRLAKDAGVDPRSTSEIAKDTPAYRWAEWTKKINELMASIEGAGGVGAVVHDWAQESRFQLEKNLEAIIDTVQGWLRVLVEGRQA